MIKKLKLVAMIVTGLAGLACGSALAADAIAPDLQTISQGIGAKIAPKAKVRWEPDAKGRPALFSTGAIWLDNVEFSEGKIEVDILGKSQPRGSNFLGIAFHGGDDTMFDCVYFRPFNFRAPSPENSNHAVQYISHPQWTWNKLRSEKTGQYEKPLVPPPDGDEWFRAKIVVEGKNVSVFVNDATKPSLVVEKLNDRTSGKVALWGGDAGEGGYFANLKITPKK